MNTFELIPPNINTVIVRVKLKNHMHIDYNKWKCTIHGEERIVTMPEVEWHCTNIESAVHSFRQDEIKEITIRANFEE